MLGTLNQRATVLARETAADGAGGIGDSWTTLGTIWVRIEPLSGQDVYGPDADESRIRHTLTARRDAMLAAGRRVTVMSRTFLVHAVLDANPPSQFVTLLCEELP
ncbi:MAG TPA: phage head closure protein [Rhizomicrobium sp.]|jgi:SPP1 family predicted phage head-tail adaptor